MGSPANLAGIRQIDVGIHIAAVAASIAISDRCRRWFTVILVGFGRGEGEEEKGTGLTANGGRRREKSTAKPLGTVAVGGLGRGEREDGFPKMETPKS